MGFEYRSPERFGGALREVWLAPRRFFEELDPEGGPLRPALFAVVVVFLNLLLGRLLQALWLGELDLALLRLPLLAAAAAVVLGPLLVAGFAALVLFVLEGMPGRRGFAATFRALGYASGIGLVLWIPYAPLLALPYGAYVGTVAVRETLGVGTRRAAGAVVIPLLALLVILLVLAGPGELWLILTNPPGS
ncbi:MAG: YIP1 family protein [Rubrobacter sp.]|nr:YIP1 family protein [Rubrobacter sp.]